MTAPKEQPRDLCDLELQIRDGLEEVGRANADLDLAQKAVRAAMREVEAAQDRRRAARTLREDKLRALIALIARRNELEARYARTP